MGEISDILNQAKERIQTGRAAINKVVDVRQGFEDRIKPYDDRFEAARDPYNDRIQNGMQDRFGLDREYTWGDYDEMQDSEEKRVNEWRYTGISFTARTILFGGTAGVMKMPMLVLTC